ncbi:MAG: SPOR domain-containing protein [Cyanobacteria bacterium RM1_2_2]|nr:SPOR domain-containing protein [Cyanobacteria bacterium RM1_2_2]
MHRPSSIEPFTPSPSVTLHPLLQSVLDNLDVQIDEELTRYRRQRRYPEGGSRARRSLSPSSPSSQSLPSRGSTNPAAQANGSAKSFDLKFADPKSRDASPSSTAIGILNRSIQLPTPRSSIYAEPLSEQARFSEANSAEPAFAKLSSQAAVLNTVPRPVEVNQPVKAATTSAAPVSPFESSSRISSYAEQNDLSVYAPNETLQKLMQQAEAQSESVPEDYLASSEELLRSIAEEDLELRAEREPNSMLETLLTPLGVGSMLLLLMASTSLGYVIMNPSSIGWGTAAQPESSGTEAPTSAEQDGEAPSPNLASEEFVDLGLGTLSTLPKPAVRASSTPAKPKTASAKPSASSTASPSANGTSTGSPSRSAEPPVTFDSIPVAPVPQPSLSTVIVPAAPPISAPAPEPVYEPAEPAPLPEISAVSPEPIPETPPPLEPLPAVTATAPTHAAPANPQNYYYVVTDYSGDSSLQEARGAVPDAYVRNLPSEGAKVQLGAFSDQAKAQELLQELENQGIEAEVYQP